MKNITLRIIKLIHFPSLLIFFLPLFFTGCDKHYERPPGMTNLGEAKDLLLRRQFLQRAAFYVIRDEDGWAVMGTRCSREGCDLTFQSNGFLCSCCGSLYSVSGEVIRGPAKHSLPWYELLLREKQYLFTDTSKLVKPSYRFNSPDLKTILDEHGGGEQGEELLEIPQALKGKRLPGDPNFPIGPVGEEKELFDIGINKEKDEEKEMIDTE